MDVWSPNYDYLETWRQIVWKATQIGFLEASFKQLTAPRGGELYFLRVVPLGMAQVSLILRCFVVIFIIIMIPWRKTKSRQIKKYRRRFPPLLSILIFVQVSIFWAEVAGFGEKGRVTEDFWISWFVWLVFERFGSGYGVVDGFESRVEEHFRSFKSFFKISN